MRDYLDQAVAASLLDEHRGRAPERSRPNWPLVSFGLWAPRRLRGPAEAGA